MLTAFFLWFLVSWAISKFKKQFVEELHDYMLHETWTLRKISLKVFPTLPFALTPKLYSFSKIGNKVKSVCFPNGCFRFLGISQVSQKIRKQSRQCCQYFDLNSTCVFHWTMVRTVEMVSTLIWIWPVFFIEWWPSQLKWSVLRFESDLCFSLNNGPRSWNGQYFDLNPTSGFYGTMVEMVSHIDTARGNVV